MIWLNVINMQVSSDQQEACVKPLQSGLYEYQQIKGDFKRKLVRQQEEDFYQGRPVA